MVDACANFRPHTAYAGQRPAHPENRVSWCHRKLGKLAHLRTKPAHPENRVSWCHRQQVRDVCQAHSAVSSLYHRSGREAENAENFMFFTRQDLTPLYLSSTIPNSAGSMHRLLYTEKDYMGQILEQLGLWIESIILAIGYPGITLVMMAENLFPPIPSELVMPFAGFLVGRGAMNLVLAIASGTMGSVLGAIILYYIGMLAGEPLVRPFFRHYGRFFLLSEQDLDKALNAFTTHGDIIVLGGRVIPIIRSLISLPAGMNRMPLGRFLLFTTIGSTIWTSLLTIGGVILGANWEFVIEIVDQYQKLVLIVLVIAAVVFVVQRLRGLRKMAFSRSE